MEARRHAAFLIGGLVLAAALAYSLYTNPEWKSFDFSRFLATFREADRGWLALAGAAIYGTYGVRALRWKIFLDPIKPAASFANLVSATVVGFGAMGVLGRPAEIVRPYLIARKEQTSIASQLAIWVLERAFDTLILLAGLALALGQMHVVSPDGSALPVPTWWQPLARVVGMAIVAMLVLLIVLRSYYDNLSERLVARLRVLLHPQSGGQWAGRLDPLADKLALFGEGLHSLRRARSLGLCLLLSVVNWTLIAFSFSAVLAACVPASDFGAAQAIVFTGVVMGGSLFQIPAVGGGVQVAAVLVLTELFGVPVEAASSAAILIWFLSFIAVLLPAMIIMAREGIRWASLSELKSKP